MTRRSSAPERLGTTHLAQAQLNALLDTLSKREMIVVRDTLGFWNGVPQPWIVTAEALAISPSEVGRIQRARSRLYPIAQPCVPLKTSVLQFAPA